MTTRAAGWSRVTSHVSSVTPSTAPSRGRSRYEAHVTLRVSCTAGTPTPTSSLTSRKNCLYTINANTGLVTESMGSKGSKKMEFDGPSYLCLKRSRDNECGCSHHIVVSDKGNNCLKVFTSGGEFIRKLGRQGSGDRELSAPCGVCEDQEGKIVVCDSGNKRVVRFWVEEDTEMFDVILTSEQLGDGTPEGVTVTPEGHLVVGKADGQGTMACYKRSE